jgi:hypothetical protein
MNTITYISLVVLGIAFVCSYMMYDIMNIKTILSPRNLCMIKSSCSPTEGFRYPLSMMKPQEPSMDCAALIDESGKCLIEHINTIAAGAPHDYLASSSIKCLNILAMLKDCISTSSPSPSSALPPQLMEFEKKKKKVRFSDIVDEEEDDDDDDSSFSRPIMSPQSIDVDPSMPSGPISLPSTPLLDLTSIYGPDASAEPDTEVDCVTINGKSYCQVKEMRI